MKWFFIDESITDGERRQGPYSIDDIHDFVNQGKITDETLVWHTGESDWKTWKEASQALGSELPTTREEQDELLQNTIKTLEAIIEENKHRTRIPAGFIVRAIAFIIDNAILSIFLLFGIMIYLIFTITTSMNPDQIQHVADTISNPVASKGMESFFANPENNIFLNILQSPTFLIIALTLQTIYFVVFHALHSATPGKKLLHIHVETTDGNRLTWGSAIIRYIGSVFTQFTLAIYGLGYLIVCVDPKRRALHDWIARTLVVYDSPKTTPNNGQMKN